MLDTNICSYIMRERPESVLTELQARVQHRDKIGKKSSPKHNAIVDEFMARIDAVLAWDMDAVDATISIKKELSDKGTPIGNNDTMIAGHAVSENCVLVTNNRKEFDRVPDLEIENWVR